jgi:hypothetical protein
MMNMRFWTLLGGFFATFIPVVCLAQGAVELVERVPTGTINWTLGVITATGICQPNQPALPGSDQVANQALNQALSNAYETINQLRVSNCSTLHELFAAKENEYQQIKEMTMVAEVLNTKAFPDGSVQVAVKVGLSGGFAQLILPGSIRQVEPIKPLSPVTPAGPASRTPSAEDLEAEDEPAAYSGLIVDARGIGLKPSMVPVIVDESGQEVYGPAFVSREYAVQNGICQYLRWGDNLPDSSRVSPNPLIIKGLRVIPGSCNKVVVSNADGSKLKSSSLHLGFLKQCRVIIALDGSEIDPVD